LVLVDLMITAEFQSDHERKGDRHRELDQQGGDGFGEFHETILKQLNNTDAE